MSYGKYFCIFDDASPPLYRRFSSYSRLLRILFDRKEMAIPRHDAKRIFKRRDARC